MTGEASTIAADLAKAAAAHGLHLRGGCAVWDEDGVPALPDGRVAATLVLLGQIGGSVWPVFAASPEMSDGCEDAMDRWSRRIIDGLADRFGALALYPFGGPPYRPFQRWAQRADTVAPSPLGMLIHPAYGLWHGYRGALAFADAIDWPVAPRRDSPCLTCDRKPCLSTCPVGAFTGDRFDVVACRAHLERPEGAACRDDGCLARNACPVGRDYAYPVEQIRFHQAAFRRAGRARAASAD
jgi:ferredoxin